MDDVTVHEQMARDNVELYRRVIELEEQDRQRRDAREPLKLQLAEALGARADG